MFRSVLVANRGEIACRVFRTARAMGIRSLAVHSEADARAKHVREAEASFLLGPAPPRESYLRGDRVLEAAKALGAEAIHPGYGFLSENPAFAEAVVAAGLIWIGPTPSAIRAMGLKDESKRIAEEAGVPVLSGYRGADQSEKVLLKAARDIGFPVLIKAVAGGGGRGIREVKAPAEFAEQLAAARREAAAAFGDDRVLIEKLVERPRHIEVQVFGDKHGGLVHLFERDCSLQRRRQKVIEEAPAPGMSAGVREAMTSAALKVARAVAYENAGTVEFIVDGNGPLRADGFWFLEMNTRLQVEHPVTEAITGLDLVEWQFRVAAGEPLPLRQGEISLHGHAIEARICAEDPAEGFRPSVGRVLRVPSESYGQADDVRIDGAYATGDAMPAAYDNLLQKVIAAGEDREEAVQTLLESLDAQALAGLSTNQGFVYRCLAHPEFQAGEVHTGFIPTHLAALLDRTAARALAAERVARAPVAGADPWALPDGWRANAPAQRLIRFEVDGECIAKRLPEPLEEEWPWDWEGGASLETGEGALQLALGEVFLFRPPGAAADVEDAAAGDEVKAPLPGKIVALAAEPGQRVEKGALLLTLEAMKMEHALKAPRAGVVARVGAALGEQVGQGAVLVALEPEG